MRPVGGASITTWSYANRPLLSFLRTASQALPVRSTSLRPGAMVVAKSIAPSFFRALPAPPSL